MAYLEERRLARSQYREPRREIPSGQIGLHTAESIMDEVGIDSGAERVAAYMVVRAAPGSYHDLVDSDSTVHLVSYGNEAFHVGAHRLNRTTTGLSFAVRTVDWARMSTDYREAALRRGAAAAQRQSEYHQLHGAGPVPARLLSLDEVLRGERGFFYHGRVDPENRSDPGVGPPGPEFPWGEFRSYYLEDDMPLTDSDVDRVARAVWGRRIPMADTGSREPAELVLGQDVGHHARIAASSVGLLRQLLSRDDVDEAEIVDGLGRILVPAIVSALPEVSQGQVEQAIRSVLGSLDDNSE